MRQSVLGVFDSYADARSAQRALGDAGMAQANIAVYSASVDTPNGKGPRVYTPGNGDTRHHKPVFEQLEQLFGRLFQTGEFPPETEDYREFVRRGGTLLCADVSEMEVDMAVEVMRRAGAADIDERAHAWRHASTKTSMPEHGQQRSHLGERDDARQHEPPPSTPSTASTASTASMSSAFATGGSATPGARLSSGGPRTVGGMQQVTTKQTQERESAEDAQRRLDRGADYGRNSGPGSGPNSGSGSDSGLNSSLNRSPDSGPNGPNQSMNRERVGDPLMGTPLDDNPYESEFRRDYNAHYANTGASYDEYRRAYTHGAALREDERYRGYDWQQVEPSAREDWESRYPASGWERFKAAVRHGWERVIGH